MLAEGYEGCGWVGVDMRAGMALGIRHAVHIHVARAALVLRRLLGVAAIVVTTLA